MSKKKDLTLLGEVLRNHGGLLTDLCAKLDSDPAKWELALGRFLRGENPWLEDRKLKASALLDPLKTVAELPKVEGIFRSGDAFAITPEKDRKTAELVIGWHGDNFEKMFVNGGGKVEENVAEITLRPYRLKKDSVDTPIIAELGGEEACEVSISHVYELMRRQGRGQKGILLTNGYANIFYVRDAKGILWAVYCYWYSDYGFWRVDAYSVAAPDAWYTGLQVFVRDSDS